MAEYTKFALRIKTTRLVHPMIRTQAKFPEIVDERTGLYVDDAFLSKILTGQRQTPKIIQAIQEIRDLPEPD